ncbi:hypothetical protein HYH03_010011 [Edaphochlamys debaryana]|uniref:O-methyltransferase n=1 Tax=Edaphochlamys debaryana TaxID=47281 RepID=A0A835XXE7_9CHLO|nr:hypothetical protein HYH03_010011 [Edaphochlamys debaryana]|eukprot:KAG2491640.1 hypothetical protein HYH03_010011 [Edaphochlamys debaryana]
MALAVALVVLAAPPTLGEPGPLLQRLDKNIEEILKRMGGVPATGGAASSGSGHLHSGFFTAPRTRNDIAALLEQKGFKTGVELGVQRGHYSLHNLNVWKSCEKYYLVDIWAHQVNYDDLANVPQHVQDSLYIETQKTLEAFKAKTVFLRNYTSEAVKYIPDNLDFVYVDARHDYCGVWEDLTLYWPKVRVGGIIAGHDYLDAPYVKEISGQAWEKCMDGTINQGAVKGAVDDFFKSMGQHVFVTYMDAPWVTWVVLKGN